MALQHHIGPTEFGIRMKRTFFVVLLSAMCFAGFSQQKVKNVILLIGDGMGLAQSYAAYMANGDSLAMFSMPYTGLSITTCADRKVTDSGAGGTAIATGHKANYNAIGLDENGFRHPSLLKIAKQCGKSTAIVCSCDLTHATPASFMTRVKDRKMQEEIALSYLEGDCDVALGGGSKRFLPNGRKDRKNLADSLRAKGFDVVFSQEELQRSKNDKIIGLFAEEHLAQAAERGGVMQSNMRKALQTVAQNEKGFFMMLEGSKIDMEAHYNKYEPMIGELLDFDRCVAIALDFARKDGNTLVVVTADHETGGLTLPAEGKKTKAAWSSLDHTGVPVPIYSFGSGAENFTGVMQNTDIFFEIYKLMN